MKIKALKKCLIILIFIVILSLFNIVRTYISILKSDKTYQELNEIYEIHLPPVELDQIRKRKQSLFSMEYYYQITEFMDPYYVKMYINKEKTGISSDLSILDEHTFTIHQNDIQVTKYIFSSYSPENAIKEKVPVWFYYYFEKDGIALSGKIKNNEPTSVEFSAKELSDLETLFLSIY